VVQIRVLVMTLLMISPAIGEAQGFESLRAEILHTLQTIPGSFAVAFQPLGGNASLLINEKEMFHAASTMKTPVMIETFKQAREGRFALDDSVEVRNEFKSIVDGSAYRLDVKDDSDSLMYARVGGKASMRELLHGMITVSSNLATNLLLEMVGPGKVTSTMRALGANSIEVLRGVEDGKAFERGLNNRTSANDLLVILRAIAEGRAVDSSASEVMMNILLAQTFRDIIPALLPPDVKVAHKTGSITGVQHDSGIIILPDGRRYVLVILSKELTNVDEAKGVLARVSKRIYDYMMEGK
jgi:beta-lactamase class A